MTLHAMEEMAEDDLSIVDVEHGVLAGRIVQIRRRDPRGNKYVLEGDSHGRCDLGWRSGAFSWKRPVSDHYGLQSCF